MRVLVATSSFARYPDDPTAAAGNGIYELCAGLGEHVEGTIVTHAVPEAPETEQLGGFTVRRVGPQRPVASLAHAVKSKHAGRVLLAARSLKRNVAELAPGHDIAHGFWLFPGAWSVSPLSMPKLLTAPGGLDTYPSYPVLGAAIRRTIRTMDVCVAVDTTGRDVLTSLGATEARYVPTPLNVSDFEVKPLGVEPRLVFVGRLSEEKRVDVLLKAVAAARNKRPDVSLEIVGDGPERASLEELAKKLGLSHVVTFMGTQKRRGVIAALERARMLVLASRREGMPAVALEALSMGRPVVATAVGGLPTLLEGGRGITVAPGDADALMNGILDAAGRDWDQGLLRETAEGFAVEKAVASYLKIYSSLADRAGVRCEP